MDKIAKFFKKLSKKDNQALQKLIFQLDEGDFTGLKIIKLSGANYYRVRKGHFRIIFVYNQKKEIEIKRVGLRSEKTYKDL